MRYDFDRVVERRNTNSIKWDFIEEIYGEKDLLPLWVADMDFQVPREVVTAIKERADHAIYGYTGRSPQLYQAIIQWLDRRHNWKIKPEWIDFTSGVVTGLNVAVQAFTKPGDKVIIQPPVYQPFKNAVENNGRQVVFNPLKMENDKYVMNFDDLADKCDSRTKMLIFCNPHNPGGRVWDKEELQQLAEICVHNDLIIVADEIHSDFVYPGHVHTPLASISQKIAERTVTCIAPNKTFNLAGLTTAAVVISNQTLRQEFAKIIENNGVKTNIFGLTAMEAAYTYGEEWLEQLLSYLKDNLDFLMEFFQTQIPQIRPIQPEGTFLVWLDCRELKLDQQHLTELFTRKAKVALNDGAWFGVGGEEFVRINIGCPRSILAEGLQRIKQAVNTL